MSESKRVAKISYVVFTKGAVSGTGVLTRAEAVARAFTAHHTTGEVDFQVFGTVDRASVPDWLTTVKASDYLFKSNSELTAALIEWQPDILIVDSYPANLTGYFTSKDRPANVWGIMRHTPGTLGKDRYGLPYGILDRLYQIEPSNHGLVMWDDGITRERTRSIAEKEAGVKDINYQETPPLTVEEFHKWPEHYARHKRASRKLIAPIVNVEPDRILSRVEARKALLEHAELPIEEASTNKPIVLIALSTTKQDYVKAQPWMKQKLTEWGVYDLPEDERLLVQAGAFYDKLPELWRYLPGVDYFISSAGYNSFYEARYLSALGKFTGKAAFWPIGGSQEQAWRAERQEGLFSGKDYPMGLAPVENGTVYICEAIIRKLEGDADGGN